jgi:hypothetical protein
MVISDLEHEGPLLRNTKHVEAGKVPKLPVSGGVLYRLPVVLWEGGNVDGVLGTVMFSCLHTLLLFKQAGSPWYSGSNDAYS